MRSLQSCFRKFVNNVSHYPSLKFYSSNFYPSSKEYRKERDENFNDAVKTELQRGASFSENDWTLFTDKLINNELVVPGSYINPKNVSGVILRLCADFQLFDVGKAYFDLLKSKNEHNNVGILSRYLRLCAMNKEYALKNEEEIFGIYKQLQLTGVAEPLISERCISAISLFEKHWKEAFNLFEEVKVNANPSPLTYFSIAEACFRFGDVDRGWQVLRSFAEKGISGPSPDCYFEYLDYCGRLLENGKFKVEDIEKVFNFLEEFQLSLPSQAVVEKLDKFIFSLSDGQFEWSLKETYIPRSAVCSNCRKLLEPVVISSEEFKQLRYQFAKKAVIGKNVFLKSTPEEIENFRRFLAKSLPYDIVIDGLNAAFSRGRTDPLSLANTVCYSLPNSI